MSAYAVIIVTHNSEQYLKHCLSCLKTQTLLPQQIIIVDSGSADCHYLEECQNSFKVTLILKNENVGFCQANNIGFEQVSDHIDYILFLNPDTFLIPSCLQEAAAFLSRNENIRCAAITGTILGFDIQKMQPTGRYDSCGISQRWWGHWYDRGHGQECHPFLFQHKEPIAAICGAFFFARRLALLSVAISGKESCIFDPKFFMHKEDIDLSCRLRLKGWQLHFVPSLFAYHCRGWNQKRSANSRFLRLLAARNEIILHKRYGSPLALLYSLIKFAAVKFFNF